MEKTSHDLIVRCKAGVFICDCLCKSDEEMRLISPDPNSQLHLAGSKYILIQEKKRLIVHDYNQVVAQIECNNLTNVSLSNQHKYVVILDKGDSQVLTLLELPTLKIVHKYPLMRPYRKEQWPLIKFSWDDTHLFMIPQTNLEAIEVATQQRIYSVDIGVSNSFVVQPTLYPLVVCYSVQAFDSKTATLKMIDFKGTIKYDQKLQKTSELEVLWSPDGQNLLIQKGFHEDSTGQSYYGQNSVSQYNLQKNQLKELPIYDGPVHHVQWSPRSKEFILLSGFMPSGAIMYDAIGKPVFDFGKDHKNKVIWSPTQRFVMVCGFGNLDGSITMWDSIELKKITQLKYRSASICSWAPCGRQFICAKVTPRLNVDNQYTVYSYHGEELMTRKFNELYDVQFRPTDKQFQDRAASPFKQPVQEAPKKPFKPFTGNDNAFAQQLQAMKQVGSTGNARVLNGNEIFAKQQEPQGPPGFIPEATKKKKRVRKPKQDGTQDAE